jgi:hypothetical protein
MSIEERQLQVSMLEAKSSANFVVSQFERSLSFNEAKEPRW